MEPILNEEELTSFAKPSLTGRVSFEGSADVSLNLQDGRLKMVTSVAEISVPFESIMRSGLWMDSRGTIRILVDRLQILLDIEPTADQLGLFARMQEWAAGLSGEGNHPSTTTEDN